MEKEKLPTTIDCQYLHPRFAAAYLLQSKASSQKNAAFVENNTSHAVPRLMETLPQEDLEPKEVEFVIVTHVHLDHAGGSSALMKACPQATLLAHPRAAPHLIDPAKLVKSARAVYGDEVFQQLYGEILPIDSKRVRIVQDGEDIRLGSRNLHFFYTRGHANHHFCVYDSASEGIFTGDSFGIAYPALQTHGLFIFPTTSPTDFDPGEARKSIQKILDFKPKRVFLTHFGELGQVREAADQLLQHLDFSESLLEEAFASSEADEQLTQFCESRLRQYYAQILDRNPWNFGKSQGAQDPWELLKLDLELNAAGIAHIAVKRRHPKNPTS